MKAKVIETGEIVNVSYYGCPTYAVFDCNNRIKELYDADELEFEPGPKMVSMDKVCNYLRSLTYQEYPGGPTERMISDEYIEEFKNRI